MNSVKKNLANLFSSDLNFSENLFIKSASVFKLEFKLLLKIYFLRKIVSSDTWNIWQNK